MEVYDTVSQAVNDLKKRGYTVDFNLKENSVVSDKNDFDPDDFEINETYRFEGLTDPADEAVVYAITSTTGMKGVLVNAFGVYAEPMGDAMAKKLTKH